MDYSVFFSWQSDLPNRINRTPIKEAINKAIKTLNADNNGMSLLAKDAKYIYEHIESDKIGKGVFAYALAEKITDDFVVPDYISNAVLWACGGKSL